jgi:hypothetical protein
MAAACLLLALSVPVMRSVRSGLVVPPPPHLVRFEAAVPLDALVHTTQTVAEAPSSEIADGTSPAVGGKESSTKPGRSAKHLQSRQKPALNLRSTPAKAVVAALPASPAVKEPAAPANSGLQIEVTSAVTEGTLIVFADRQLLFSVDLATEKKGQLLHFENALPAGPHQFRVALYKADRSLQLEKEGFAETRGDGANTLAVRIARHAKLLVRRELALEVTWPGASTPHAERASGAGALRTAGLVQ